MGILISLVFLTCVCVRYRKSNLQLGPLETVAMVWGGAFVSLVGIGFFCMALDFIGLI